MFKYGHDISDADLAFACHFVLLSYFLFLYLYIYLQEYEELPTQKHLSKNFVASSTDVVYR